MEQAARPDAPVAREMREAAAPRGEVQAPPTTEPPARPAPSSSSLVDDVLSMGSEDEAIFGEFDEDDPGDREKGRRGRKDKKDKHFFWE